MFVAFAPYKSPELVATVVLENAGGGSSNAAPIVRALFDEYFDNLASSSIVQPLGF
jgi:penicillin-binding protein 2